MSGLGLGCCTAPLPVPSGKIKIWLCPYPILCFVRRETGNRPTHPFSLKATLCLFFPTLEQARELYTDAFIQDTPMLSESPFRMETLLGKLQEQPGGFIAENMGVVPLYCWNRDGMIQTLSSTKYDLKAPDGMSKDAWTRMKETRQELRDLLDARIPFLLE